MSHPIILDKFHGDIYNIEHKVQGVEYKQERKSGVMVQTNSTVPMTNPNIIIALGILAVNGVPEWGTGRKCLASSFCCAADCLNATKPTMMPAAKKMRAMMSQSTPHTTLHKDISGRTDRD